MAQLGLQNSLPLSLWQEHQQRDRGVGPPGRI